MNAIRFALQRSFLATLSAIVLLSISMSTLGSQSIGPNPLVPTVSIKAVVAETREPFCDPAICDAAPPPPGVVRLTRTGGDVSRELTVFVAIEGTASNGVDITKVPEGIVFAAGSDATDVLIEAAYDLLYEGDESVVIRLLPDPSMGPIGMYELDPSNTAARVLIHDHQTAIEPTVRIETTSPIAEESSYPYRRLAFRGVFTISRSGPTDVPLSVFVHYSGSATPGEDYPALPWRVTIPAGADRTELVVEPIPDNVAEPIEILDATLSQCPPQTQPPLGIPCYAVNIDPLRSTARVFLRDDGITTATLSITSPEAGDVVPAGQPVEITATAIDLEGAITSMEFFDDETKIGESSIFFFREPDPGTPITHSFTWDRPAAGRHHITASARDAGGNKVISAPVEFKVGDGIPVVSIEASVPETTEPSPTSRIRPGVFTVRRTGSLDRSLRVWMQYSGTAREGDDFAALPRIVEFASGVESIDLLVAPENDSFVEPDETVIAELVPSPLAVLPEFQIDPLKRRAEVVIHDNGEALTVVSIRATRPVTSEPCPVCLVAPGIFTISRRGDLNSPLGVYYRLGGTARNGEDYDRLSGYAVIPSGAESVDVRILAIMDEMVEGDETVVATLALPDVVIAIHPPPPPPYRIDPAAPSATITIRDNPLGPRVPAVSIVATDPFGREGGLTGTGRNSMEFTLRRSGDTTMPLAVHFSLGGTATSGVDYSTPVSPLVIPAGQSRARMIVEPVDDSLPEGIETVVVTLVRDPVTPTAYELGFPRRAAAIIVDNDRPRPPCLRLPDGSFNLCLPAGTNACFRVEATEDLELWTPLCVVPATEERAHFVDPDASGPRRFYRVIPVPCEEP